MIWKVCVTPRRKVIYLTHRSDPPFDRSRLVLLQQPDFDGQVVTDLLVPLPLALEGFLGLLQFGQGGCIPGPQVQLLQVHSVRIVLDPGGG